MFDTSIHYEVYTEEPPHIPKRCVFADKFYFWTEPIMKNMMLSVSHVRLNQTLVQVTKKYREWRNRVPKAHMNHIGDAGHICIFHVWDECCRAIEAIEISLTPPQLEFHEPVTDTKELIIYDEPLQVPDLGLFTGES